MDIQTLHALFLSHSTVITDSRKVSAGGIFFALKGDNFNGNQFAVAAIEQGASYAIVDEVIDHPKCIQVEDVLQTLQDLAHFHRVYLGLPIIAITGSNGKTTTKELAHAVLGQKFKTIATRGNLNNHIGVPLTLLSMDSSTEMGIVEMGANHLGEITALAAIAAPDYGYITNFGKAHLEGFGSIAGVIKGKSELYDYLKTNEKIIFQNVNDPLQHEILEAYPHTYTFGKSGTVDCSIFPHERQMVCVEYDHTQIQSQLIGAYNFNNIAAAIAIGSYFGVATPEIVTAIETYIPQNNRSQIIQSGTNTIILDAYNANPTSMLAALDNLSQTDRKNKVVILGDMLELGTSSAKEHQDIAHRVESMDLISAYLVGPKFSQTATERAIRFNSIEELRVQLETKPLDEAYVLIKGSRGMALEQLLSSIV